MNERDLMNYGVAIVGAGPAGLACAIRLRQLTPQCSVCVVEKGASVGAHALSGAVVDAEGLAELLPDWRAELATCVPVRQDELLLLGRRRALRLPTPPQQRNAGNYILSLGQLTQRLAQVAEGLGVDVFAGFAATEPLLGSDGGVAGVRLGDMGRRRDGSEGPNFSPGAEIRAPVTVIAEGCRGSLAKQLIARFELDAGRSPQNYALGFKELWQLPAGRTRPGLVQHSVGWPLDGHTYGGGFVYHLEHDQLYVGLVVGLDYRDPRLKPFEAFQQFKQHPRIRPLLEGGEPLAYGARAIAAGGWQALPRLDMPGALLIGDAAGTLNVARLKGVHQAVRSGMLAAEHLAASATAAGFDARWRASAAARELRAVRNIKPGFKHGLWLGLGNALLETVSGGHTPWTLAHAPVEALTPLAQAPELDRGWHARTLPPRDRAGAVFLAAIQHDEDQPIHLHVADPSVCVQRCQQEYGNPCTRFCPAAVYEMVEDAGGRRLQINAANCVHCKACDIKDPYRIITWVPPEGGSGPNYQNL
jgi:electron-transferring-flavoprotein dehydrogenase